MQLDEKKKKQKKWVVWDLSLEYFDYRLFSLNKIP